ncbi:pyridoxal phosphate-dependent aminotransferase [Jannaschia aquimarina]|uniref:aspartate transaminase n=1 Tax=Jannaschia aquimarina TaxID=935700 RepID=A0A0D1EJU0_9RHOB|nr:pyridoxal phosphate-dependent aminotransferase [Jannaschia aquimarina]KIT17819.1 Arginine--pyruvate transaminase AruH [Jannaschia aquimarina]SNS90817.1 arginine:pyruvate transaminase [Jannaschia aquimarina]
MKTTSVTRRLAGSGGAKWAMHTRAVALTEAGRDVIALTIGEPDVPVPASLCDAAIEGIHAGRLGYSSGRGEPGLRNALAAHYTARTGRKIGPESILCVPGTQTALYLALQGVAEAGDEVMVGDPMYATYEGVIRASGAGLVPVPLAPDAGFLLRAEDLAARITSRSRAILLNTPHNPTGAVLTAEDIAEIGEVARSHDLWIISDEVYADLIFDDHPFASPLARADLAERTIVVSSISKSHAAPGFRSGWCVASPAFVDAVLPLAEAMLFGNQPFIADMTARAIREGSPVSAGMRARFAARADRLANRLAAATPLRVHRPQAGMFALIDAGPLGIDGTAFAERLLEEAGVAVMPGASFGSSLDDWVRVALTVEDTRFDAAIDQIVAHCAALAA